MYICICKGITDSQIVKVISSGQCGSVKDLQEQLGVASQCGKCGTHAKCIVKQIKAQIENRIPVHTLGPNPLTT